MNNRIFDRTTSKLAATSLLLLNLIVPFQGTARAGAADSSVHQYCFH
ncbi:hypothetical protein [Paenibacillus donghaensis]|nr:hypothetical protein [Paenibacillus donghaensis]